MMLVEDMQIAFYRNAAELVFIVFIEVDECAYVVHGSACAYLQFYTVEQMAYHDGREDVASARDAHGDFIVWEHEMLFAGRYAEAFYIGIISYY